MYSFVDFSQSMMIVRRSSHLKVFVFFFSFRRRRHHFRFDVTTSGGDTPDSRIDGAAVPDVLKSIWMTRALSPGIGVPGCFAPFCRRLDERISQDSLSVL